MKNTSRSLLALSSLFVFSLALGACDSDTKTPQGKDATTAKKVEPPKHAEVKAGPDSHKIAGKPVDGVGANPAVKAASGKDERYDLAVEVPEAKVGEAVTAKVKVVPKGKWHMNLDYPTKLKLAAPEGVALTKAELKKGDAALSEQSCAFDVGLTASSAGDKTITGEFKFAVCQDEACAPVTEKVELKVAVK